MKAFASQNFLRNRCMKTDMQDTANGHFSGIEVKVWNSRIMGTCLREEEL